MDDRYIQKWQTKIFWYCWTAYAISYLCRSNISIALTPMMEQLGWDKTQAGMIGTVFFWIYALGQLINGYLGDKIPPKYFMISGMIITTAANLAMGMTSSLGLAAFFWGLNGFGLSMLWGPVMRMITQWFAPEQRGNVILLSFSSIAGFFVAWGLLGALLSAVSWRWAFWIPSAVMAAFALLWTLRVKNNPTQVGLVDHSAGQASSTGAENMDGSTSAIHVKLTTLIIKEGLILVSCMCLIQGFIKESISYWTPTILSESAGSLGSQIASLFSVILPLTNIFGIFFLGWCNKKFGYQSKRPLKILLLLCILSGLCLLLFYRNFWCIVVFMSLLSTLMHGVNTVLLSFIPLAFAKYNKISGVSGFLNFTCYMGATVGGILSGFMSDRLGWSGVFLVWLLTTLACLGIFFVYEAFSKKRERMNVQPVHSSK